MNLSAPLIQEYLSNQRLGRLATATKDGTPHVVAVAYTNDKDNLYISTITKTKKVRILRKNSKAAFIVDDSGGSAGWRYVIVEGHGHLISSDEEFNRVRNLLCEKYPSFLSEEWGIKRESHTLIRVEPKKIITANI